MFRLPNLLASRFGRLTAFFFLYVTEGIPLGFTATAVATQMRRQGLSPGEISVFVGWLYFPFAIKFLFGPAVDLIHNDRWGRRRAWIVVMQTLIAITLLATMPVDYVSQLRLFTFLVVLVNVFGAVQDVAIDALACNTLQEDERGLGNGLMFAGASVGQAIGGAGVLMLSGYIGFNGSFVLVAGCILAVTLLVSMNLREQPQPSTGRDETNVALRFAREIITYLGTALKSFFGSRPAILGMIFALLPTGSMILSMGLATSLQVELGMSDDAIAWLTLFSSLLFAVSCVGGGFLSDLIGRRLSLAIYVVLTIVPVLVLASAMQTAGWIMPIDMDIPDHPVASTTLLYTFHAAILCFSAVQGLLYGTKTALIMDICNPHVAATQFTAYMALMNVTIIYTARWQGLVIDGGLVNILGRWSITVPAMGYPATLCADAVVGCACLLPLALMWKGPCRTGELPTDSQHSKSDTDKNEAVG